MDIRTADFVSSYTSVAACPKEDRVEFAFIGRSNVGKSSLINMLTGKKGLAKVSGTPGKTRLLNYFLINEQWYLVDLPGYGYAKVSKSEQKNLASMIQGYLRHREAMAVAFVLIDSTIEPSKVDLQFINTLGEGGVPFALVFTKSDRVGGTTLQNNVQAFLDKMSESWETLPPHFITSSEYRIGKEELLSFIYKTYKKIRKAGISGISDAV